MTWQKINVCQPYTCKSKRKQCGKCANELQKEYDELKNVKTTKIKIKIEKKLIRSMTR